MEVGASGMGGWGEGCGRGVRRGMKDAAGGFRGAGSGAEGAGRCRRCVVRREKWEVGFGSSLST